MDEVGITFHHRQGNISTPMETLGMNRHQGEPMSEELLTKAPFSSLQTSTACHQRGQQSWSLFP